MGGRRRNKNKTDREDLAVYSSSTRRKNTQVVGDNASEMSDVESTLSHLTVDDELRSNVDEIGDDEEIIDDVETLSDRFGEYMENATHKNVSIRIAALNNASMLLSKCFMPDDLEKWKNTAIEVIEKALKRTPEEAFHASLFAALISLQLGEEIGEELENVIGMMRQLCTDPSQPESLRTQCIQSIASCSFYSSEQPVSLTASASALRSLWIGTKTNAASVSVFCAAVAGWTLLVCEKGENVLTDALFDQPKLCTFVNGTQLEMRVSAGEALVVLYESALRTFGEGYRFPNQQHVLDLFADLSTDSQKFRAKRERKTQKYTYRQMYAAIADQEVPETLIKFDGEVLCIDTSIKKLVYEMTCNVLRSGMNIHLKNNIALRDWFDLGPVRENTKKKMAKQERLAIQNAVNKTRDVKRAKQRGKRSVVF